MALSNIFRRVLNREAGNQTKRRGRTLRVESLESRQMRAGIPADVADVDLHDCGSDMHATFLVSTEEHHENHEHVHGTPLSDESFADVAEVQGASLTSVNPFALSQTFELHSNPGASKRIYLDFDGHNWRGTLPGGAGDRITPAYSTDGNPAFSDEELGRIQRIWARVKEDFLPFNVDVTTEDPGVEALKKSGSGDNEWGIRVAVGGDGSWYTPGGIGLGYLNSFTHSTDKPAFVFTRKINSEKVTADTISHEVGHTLGLNHDGVGSDHYYRGHGNWRPLMGSGGSRGLVTQFSRGEYLFASNQEDDLAIIASAQNGFGYRSDDHGNSNSSATRLIVSAGNQIAAEGLIERNTDVDVFALDAGAGRVTLEINPAEYGPNLDILAKLYDSAGNLIATADPANNLAASITVDLTAGRYYLHVDGTGDGDPLTNGYSDYGSLGFYSIEGQIQANQPATGDRIGVFRAGRFLVDVNGDTAFDGQDATHTLGAAGDTPIVGDWNGDGKDEIGVHRENRFYLDANGNGRWDGVAGGDKLYYFGAIGDKPVIGDWNGDGKDSIGIFRKGVFYLDQNGDGKFLPGLDRISPFGGNNDDPVAGDWNGDGRDDIGVFRNTTGVFYRDQNGNGQWDGGSVDLVNQFGAFGDKPVTGDWNDDGIDDLGVHRRSNSTIYRDTNANGRYDAGDSAANFGAVTDIAVSGKWQVPSPAIGALDVSAGQGIIVLPGNQRLSDAIAKAREDLADRTRANGGDIRPVSIKQVDGTRSQKLDFTSGTDECTYQTIDDKAVFSSDPDNSLKASDFLICDVPVSVDLDLVAAQLDSHQIE